MKREVKKNTYVIVKKKNKIVNVKKKIAIKQLENEEPNATNANSEAS